MKHKLKYRKVLRHGLFLLVIAFLLSGCGIMPEEQEILTPPLAEPEKVTYKTAKVKQGAIENSFVVTGFFVPSLIEDIAFENVNGRLKAINVKVGDTVEAGDELAKINVDDIDLELEKQAINLDIIQTNYNYIKDKAAIDIIRLKSEIERASTDYETMLSNQELYSISEVKQASSELEKKKMSLTDLEMTSAYQTKLKENELKLARINIKTQQEKVDKSRLLSPISGLITYVDTIKEGNYIEPYKTVVRITSPTSLELQYNGTKANQFRLGLAVEISINKEKYVGEVVSIPTSVPLEKREEYKDIVVFEIKEMKEQLGISLKSGDKADIKVTLASAENALILPLGAIKTFEGKKLVYLFEDGMKLERYVDIGVESKTEVQIINGIGIEDQVIIE